MRIQIGLWHIILILSYSFVDLPSLWVRSRTLRPLNIFFFGWGQYRQVPVDAELSRLQFNTPLVVETAVHSPVMATTTESAHKMAVIPEFHPVTVIDPEPCHVTANLPEPCHASTSHQSFFTPRSTNPEQQGQLLSVRD